MNCDDARELITALVDDELSQDERRSIEGHLNDCPKCELIYRQEQALKQEIRRASAALNTSARLKEKILSDLRGLQHENQSHRAWIRWPWFVMPLPRRLLVTAFVLLLILPTFHRMRPTRQPISLAALEIHEKYLKGGVSFVKANNRNEIKEYLSASVKGAFAPMEYDFSMKNLHAIGGSVQEMVNRKILVTLYDGAAPAVSCHTFLGTEADIPDNAAVFFEPGRKINFYAFSRNGINAVLHHDEKALCLLVSKMPMEDLLALAKSQPKLN